MGNCHGLADKIQHRQSDAHRGEINHVVASGDAPKIHSLDWVRGAWTLPVLHKMINLEKMSVDQLDSPRSTSPKGLYETQRTGYALKTTEFPASIEPKLNRKVDLSNHTVRKDADVSGLNALWMTSF